MNFDPGLMLLSLVPSGIGFVLFVYGKKQQRWVHLATGIALMAYPYFVTSVLQMVGGLAIIGGVWWYAVHTGW